MPSPKRDKFLKEVLSYIKFPFDRDKIKFELESHISDKIQSYFEQGYNIKEAEELAIKDMGDPKAIGIGLNKEHNPVIGWIWGITNIIVALFGAFTIYISAVYFLGFTSIPVQNIPKSDIVYQVDVSEKIKLDDKIIKFTKLIYDKDGNMNIYYEYYTPKFWRSRWSLGRIGEVSDNLGNIYRSYSGGSGGGLKTKNIQAYKNFSSEADTLIIDYDFYNRKYKVELPLKAGVDYD